MSYDIYDDYEFIPLDGLITPPKKKRKAGALEEKLKKINNDIEKTDDSGYLKEVLTDKISLLEEILKDLDEQIKDREYLKDSIVKKFDEGICYLRTKLYEIDSWELGKNRTIDSRRSKIEQELEQLKSQKRTEARECWRDIALLKKEKREFFKEYRDALRRVKVIFPEKFKGKSLENEFNRK